MSKHDTNKFSESTDSGKGKSHEKKLKNAAYEKELAKLQIELVKLQEWIRHKNLKVVVIFEGRDAAGKGGVIKRITESLSPRICRVVALAAPTNVRKRNGISRDM
jgi:polyphosphate kinase 2 (PPK2 family)